MSSIFISYSHKNSEVLERLRVHLKPLERSTKVSVFSDTDINADEIWRDRIRKEIDECSLAVLLVSADFLASDFINDEELPKLFLARKKQSKTVLTVFVSPSMYKLYPDLEKFQGFNTPDQPLSSLDYNESEALFARLAAEINTLVSSAKVHESISGSRPKRPDLDYQSILGQTLFSNVKISIPRLVSELENSDISGFSFHDCDLVGPAVLWCPIANFSSNQFNIPSKSTDCMFLNPVSDVVVGVIPASHIVISGCQVSNISFLDPDGNIKLAMEQAANSTES